MLFVISKIFWYVATPGNFFLTIAVMGILWLAFTHRRRGFSLVLVGVGGLMIVTVLPISSWAIAPLENRFPSPKVPDRIDGIIVLGGGVNPLIAEMRQQISVADASERLFSASMLARLHPEARIIVSGGDSSIVPSGLTEAIAMRDVLVSQGIDTTRVELESTSRNTYENAVNSKALAQPKPGENWVLITSGWHMPRAVGCFRSIDWSVLPYPVDYRTSGTTDIATTFIMSTEFRILNLAAKEWIGLVVYRLLGRTNQLFPGP